MQSKLVETEDITNKVRNHKETLHEGTFKLESEKGKGSIFTEIPINWDWGVIHG